MINIYNIIQRDSIKTILLLGILLTFASAISCQTEQELKDFLEKIEQIENPTELELELIKSAKADLNDNFKKGSVYASISDFENAVKYYTLALIEIPENDVVRKKLTSAIRQRGCYYHSIDDCKRAIKDYTKFLSIKRLKNGNDMAPIDSEVYYNRGVCFMRLEKWGLAVFDLTDAIERGYLFDGKTHYNRAICNLNNNKVDEACPDFHFSFFIGFAESKYFIDKYCK